MAHFEKRGGMWRVRAYRNGKRASRTFHTKAEAEAWAVAYQKQPEGMAPPGTRLSALFDKYKQEITPGKKGSRSELLRIARLDKALGHIALEILSEAHLSAYRDTRLGEVKPGSVIREFVLISAILNKGVKWKWLVSNPAKSVDRPPKPAPRDRRISDDEAELIYHACGYSPDEPPMTVQSRVGAAFRLGIASAMRAGEMVNMRWGDIEGKVATVTGKTGKRRVPLTPEAIAVIEQLRGVTEDTVLGITSAQLDALFRKARDRAGIKEMTFHDTRAESLTRLSRKVDVLTLARISGHKDLSLLERVYYRETAEDIAERLSV